MTIRSASPVSSAGYTAGTGLVTPTKRHTIVLTGATNSVQVPGSGFDVAQRYAVCPPVASTRWRLVVGNINASDGTAGTGTSALTGCWFGSPGIATSGNRRWDGSFTSTPTQAFGSLSVPQNGTDVQSAWITDPTLQFQAGQMSVLSIGVTTSNDGNGIALGGNVQMFAKTSSGSASAGNASGASFGIQHGYILDVRVEMESQTNMPVGLFIGDSITEGGGEGDITATQIMPLAHETYPGAAGGRFGFLAVNAGISGATTASWNATNLRRFTRFDLATTVPNFAVIKLGTNEVGSPLTSFQSGMATLVAAVRTLNIPRIYLGTVLPGNYGAGPEAVRVSMNDWIKQAPLGVDGVFDFDAVLSSSLGSTTCWSKYISTDNVHPLRSGYQRMASQLGTICLA